METNRSPSPPPPALDYAPPPRTARLRRWLRPGSAAFFVLVLALTVGGSWWGWKWRVRADERAFHECARSDAVSRMIFFTKPPNAASLRHLERLPGKWCLNFNLSADPGLSGSLILRGRRFPNVNHIIWEGDTDVDPWLIEFSRPDSGLTALVSLNLSNTPVSDAGFKELTRPDSGLRSLTTLSLYRTPVTDAGLNELARPDSGLKSLNTLILYGTQVTDAGLKKLARPDGGLKSLVSLNLHATKVTDAGLKDLARPDSGLKSLASLNLMDTQVTDAGLKEFARPDSGLKLLILLNLSFTRVTDGGVQALQKDRPRLRIRR